MISSTQAEAIQLNLSQLKEAIDFVTSGDNDKISKANDVLTKFINAPESITVTLALMGDMSEGLKYRQTAAIVFKHSVNSHLGKLAVGDAATLRQKYLEVYFAEQVNPIRNLHARNLGLIAQDSFKNNNPWDKLLETVSQACENADKAVAFKGYLLLSNVLGYCAPYLADNFDKLGEFLYKQIQDEASENKQLRAEALKGLAYIILAIEQEDVAEKYKPVFKTIMNKFDNLVGDFEDEELYDTILDLICDLCDKQSPILTDNMNDLMNYLNSDRILLNVDISDDQKVKVVSVLMFISNRKISAFTRNVENLDKLAGNLIRMMLERDEEAQQLAAEGQRSITEDILELFCALAKNVPKKTFFPIIQKYTSELQAEGSALSLKLMYWIYSKVVEGLSDYFKPTIKDIIETLIKPGVQHADLTVRNAALKATLMMSEYLMPEIATFHSEILPIVAQSLESENLNIVNQAIFCLDIFTEGMEPEDLGNYLGTLVEKIITAIQHESASLDVRKFGINALGSMITASKEAFGPYFEQTFNLMKNLLKSEHPDIVTLRGSVIAVLGRLIGALGEKNPEIFQNHYPEIHSGIMKICLEQKDDYDIICGSFTYHAECTIALKEGYSQEVAPKLMGLVEECMSLKNTYDSELEGNPNFADDNEEEGEMDGNIILLTQVCILQAEVLHYLASVAEHAPMFFQQYIEMAKTLVADNIYNYDKHIRQQCGGLIKMILTSLLKSSNNGLLPVYTKGLPCSPLPAPIANFFKANVLSCMMLLITSEIIAENTRIYIEMLKDSIKECGPFVIQENSEQLYELINDILSFNIGCFDRGQEGDEDYESDGVIFIQVCDLLIEVTKIMKDSSKEFMSKVMPNLWNMVSKGGILELEEFIGAFCDFIENCPSLLPESKDHVCKLIFNSPSLQDEMACRNSAFCLGIMFETDPALMTDKIADGLKFLTQVFELFEDDAVRDNVVASVCRLYVADTQGLVPLDQLIQNIKDRFPFTGDAEENKMVVTFGSTLIQKNPAKFGEHLDTFVKIIFTVIGNQKDYGVEDSHREQIKGLIAKISGEEAGKASLESNLASGSFDGESIKAFMNQ